MQVEKSRLERMCKWKNEVITAKEQEIAAIKRALSHEWQRVSLLTNECATLKGRLEGTTETFESLQAHIKTVEVWQNTFEG